MSVKSHQSLTLSDGSSLDPFILQILNKRNLVTEKEIRTFLEPQLKDLPDPFLMQGMEAAASIVGDGVMNRESILIWGDYDVDGTTATALLIRFFNAIACAVTYYIPNRLTEGYGVQSDVLRRVTDTAHEKADILITVDNGISAHEAVQTARELGYKVIVTDHHTPPEAKVEADAILNPRQNDCNFPGENLAGVGVAFYFAAAVRSYLSKNNYFNEKRTAPNLKQFLGLVAVGTVADMVELDAVNRILVRGGMESLSHGGNYGLTALCAKCNLDSSMLRSEDISFQLAPKINAAGRLGVAEKAVTLMVTHSKEEAEQLTATLFTNNEKRKDITLGNFSKAKDEVFRGKLVNAYATIVSGEYHIGVAGIVASNLVEKYKQPAIVLCEQANGVLKGSARSVVGVNLHTALAGCSEVLLGFGGHAMAAGMSLEKSSLLEFKKLFNKAVFSQNYGQKPETGNNVETDMAISKLFTPAILKQLLLLEPHGVGNPQLVFRDTSVRFSETIPIGKDKAHLRLSVINGKSVIKGIAFGLGELAGKCRGHRDKSVLYSPSLNFFRGRRSWQVRVIDISFDE